MFDEGTKRHEWTSSENYPNFTVKRPHLERLMHVIALLKPKNILEVGPGIGRNLFAIAGTFPDIHLTGLELSRVWIFSDCKFSSWPQKIDEGQGLVVARRVN